MNYKIIGDSCTDVTEDILRDDRFELVPLTLEIGDYSVIDKPGVFDQKDFLKRVKEAAIGPKTACPSPGSFFNAIENADCEEVYIVTLSSHLSGSYQAARAGLSMYMEETPPEKQKKVHIFDSESASTGQYLIVKHIIELKNEGKIFEDIISSVTEQLLKARTFFVLETLETLRKNGRLTGIKAFLASKLNIKPVMGAVRGVIVQIGQQRGINKALKEMIDKAVEAAGGPEKCQFLDLAISHVNCPERAKFVKEEFLKKARFKSITILETMGVSTTYACDGGIIMTL